VTSPDVTGIVLAGGASRRFGRDKLREDVRGEPLLAHAVRRVGEVCPRVLVVGAPGRGLPPLPADLRVEVVHDDVGWEGPLRATARALRAVETEWSVVVGGDMPDLRPSVLSTLLALAEDRDAPGAALGEAGGLRPLPCVLRTDPALRAAEPLLAAGDRRLRSLLEALPVAVLPEAGWLRLDPERRTLVDVDEPADLDGLRD
jgi:molybdopterin-guanine dinucleotide biosynthesis protein A